MGKFGPGKFKEVLVTLPKNTRDFPDSIELKKGDDLVIPYREENIAMITLPDGLFSPSGRGVTDRTSRAEDGLFTRSATAFHCGKGDIVVAVNGPDGKEQIKISCIVS